MDCASFTIKALHPERTVVPVPATTYSASVVGQDLECRGIAETTLLRQE